MVEMVALDMDVMTRIGSQDEVMMDEADDSMPVSFFPFFFLLLRELGSRSRPSVRLWMSLRAGG